MTYRVLLERRAERALADLPRDAVHRIMQALRALGEMPRPPGVKKLTAREGYRIRIGVYRALYTVVEAAREVRVELIGHRREVYR